MLPSSALFTVDPFLMVTTVESFKILDRKKEWKIKKLSLLINSEVFAIFFSLLPFCLIWSCSLPLGLVLMTFVLLTFDQMTNDLAAFLLVNGICYNRKMFYNILPRTNCYKTFLNNLRVFAISQCVPRTNTLAYKKLVN